MISPFAWIRQQAASAVMNGIADACQAVTPPGEQPPADLAQLRQLVAARLVPALPPAPQPDDTEPAKRGRKAVGL